MGVVRINDKLKKDVLDYISEEDHKYTYPNISTFVNSAIFEKLKKSNGVKNEKHIPA
ncbi:MAG: hypothetical protein KAJ91_00575 [Candidatus Aenigmarchaeota archaeon]|nr:hypothetical protein [Candidatus Aenigmarchaeota archaeon]